MSRQPISTFELTSTDGSAPAPDASWIPAVVPGGVHESLLANGDIEHPYYGDNEDKITWIEDATWWYRSSFAGPGEAAADERITLVLNGLDTVATIWLNGEELGSHCNQLRPASYDVTSALQPTNELLIRFSPPLAGLEIPAITAETQLKWKTMSLAQQIGKEGAEAYQLPPELARTQLRKASFSWGWDFGARVPSLGIIAPVELVRERRASISGRHLRTTAIDAAASIATLAVTASLDLFAGTADSLRISITSPSGAVQEIERPAAATVDTEIEIADAQLWWTHDLGDQPLYSVTLSLIADGEVLDSTTDRVGLRTIELDQSADPEGGSYFRFILNGVGVYARGANWVPASCLVGSVTDERYRALVDIAVRGEMNMIRMWGGGIYEPAAFFDACDESGVLVWQDFMFACTDYPDDDPALVAEVIAEAAFQVQRLRNHASLALWCGNNEVDALHGMAHGDVDTPGWGYTFFTEILPDAVATHAPGAIYWRSSPWGEGGAWSINGVLDGDRHAWEVWHGLVLGAAGPTEFATKGEQVHFKRYGHDTGKFISEFGIHAAPELSTLERWTPAGSLELRSEAFDFRNKDNPKDKGWALMEHETGEPVTLAQYVDYSMATQAEGLKYGVEHYRRRQPHNSGTLVWQFNDVWPGFSWSVVDYDLIPKAGYYFLQRAYQPVLASFKTTEDSVELWVSNSGRTDVELSLIVEIAGFSGASVVEEKLTVSAPATSSQKVWSAPLPSGDQLAWVSSPSGDIEANRAFFSELKNLPLGQSTLSVETKSTGADSAEVTITSHGYSYFTRVLTPEPGVVIDTNYFDLRDGEQRVVTVTGLPTGFDPSTLKVETYVGAPNSRTRGSA